MRYLRVIQLLAKRIRMNDKRCPTRRPSRPVPVIEPELAEFLMGDQSRAIWFGHSTVLLQLEGKLILCDPVLKDLLFLFTIFTGKRFTNQLPIPIEEFPPIDILLLSHDHYDHMDYKTIMALNHKVKHYCVPRGVGARLESWGIERESITEFSYGESWQPAELRFVCTPSSHFSGRGLHDRNRTLWCSWVITGKKANVFFSGDGSYGPHFERIGNEYGPFDLTFMECGQEINFGQIHMVPEQAVQAQIDLKGKLMVPIHWGMFSQSNTDWAAQIERLLKAAQEKGVQVATPMIGEMVSIGLEPYPQRLWWNECR